MKKCHPDHLKQRPIKCDYPYQSPKHRQNSGKYEFWFLFLLGFDKFSLFFDLNDFRCLRLLDGAHGDSWDFFGSKEIRNKESTAYFLSSKVIGCGHIGDTPGSPQCNRVMARVILRTFDRICPNYPSQDFGATPLKGTWVVSIVSAWTHTAVCPCIYQIILHSA